MHGTPVSAHLQPHELAAFLGARPRGPDGSRVRQHLAECEECRGEAIEVARLVRVAAQPSRLKLALPLALAAGIAAIVLTGRLTDRPEAVLRGTKAGAPASLDAVAPREEVSRASGPLTFRWRHLPEVVEYRVTLLDATGSVVWSVVTSDSTVMLPVGVSLAPGGDYYWYVDALRTDGTSMSSRARRFHMTP